MLEKKEQEAVGCSVCFTVFWRRASAVHEDEARVVLLHARSSGFGSRPSGGLRVQLTRYITIAHGTAQRPSEKWRHFACTSVLIIFVHLYFVLAWGAGLGGLTCGLASFLLARRGRVYVQFISTRSLLFGFKLRFSKPLPCRLMCELPHPRP